MSWWGWFALYWVVAIPAGSLVGKYLKGRNGDGRDEA